MFSRPFLARTPARLATQHHHRTFTRSLPHLAERPVDPVASGDHPNTPKAKINVPLENTPLFLFVGFVVSVGLGTLFWNYEKSDEVRKTPGPEVGRREDRFEPPLVKDHLPKKTDE